MIFIDTELERYDISKILIHYFSDKLLNCLVIPNRIYPQCYID